MKNPLTPSGFLQVGGLGTLCLIRHQARDGQSIKSARFWGI
jgi:hypothetical protein